MQRVALHIQVAGGATVALMIRPGNERIWQSVLEGVRSSGEAMTPALLAELQLSMETRGYAVATSLGASERELQQRDREIAGYVVPLVLSVAAAMDRATRRAWCTTIEHTIAIATVANPPPPAVVGLHRALLKATVEEQGLS